MSAILLAVLVAVAGVVASGIWFGVIRMRKAESELGVQALANMKWRDCINVVLEALYRDGYQRSAVVEAPAGGATEVMLSHNGRDVLLEHKHGTAYHLTDSSVREFVNNVSLNGAREGILVTLGSIGHGATHVAATHNVQLIDGATLWLKVRNYLLPSIYEGVRLQAAANTRKGLWGGALASVLAAGAVYLLAGDHLASKPEVTVAASEVAPMSSGAPGIGPGSSADTAMVAQMKATAKALAEVAKMSKEQLAVRRVQAAKRISDLPRVGMAAWSGQRTLLLNLDHPADDAKDDQLLDEICRILIQNEEMRFTRVQLESVSGSDRKVRFRLCE